MFGLRTCWFFPASFSSLVFFLVPMTCSACEFSLLFRIFYNFRSWRICFELFSWSCIWRKKSICCVRAENWIWPFFPLSSLVAYLYISSGEPREDFNAFIIGCVYGANFFMSFIKQSSRRQCLFGGGTAWTNAYSRKSIYWICCISFVYKWHI